MRKVKHKFLLIAGIVVGGCWLFYLSRQLTLPNVDIFKTMNPETSAFMRAYEGEKPLKHEWVPYEKISPHLKEAVVIAEDGHFFKHRGIDWSAFWEAMKENWEEKEFKRGGSTITQQLAKNLYLSASKNPLRKIREMMIAAKMEQNLSKQRILEIYLNVAEWGKGIYGVQAAAHYYYQTSASRLSPGQAAWLAAALPRPRYYQEHRNGSYIRNRTALILKIMGYGEPL